MFTPVLAKHSKSFSLIDCISVGVDRMQRNFGPMRKQVEDNMKADASKKAVQVTGKISDDGKTFVDDTDSKSWTISNPDAVKGHEGHHVILTAHVYADKNEVHVMSLKMAK